MSQSIIQPSFAGGELAPSLHARVDLAKYAVGLKLCRNFFAHAHGGVSNRPGTEFIGEVKDSNRRSRLIPFAFNTDQTYVLEFGHNTLRVIMDGGYVEASPGAVYEIASPYPEADLPTLAYVQSADVMTLVHGLHPPRELRRTGHAAWAFSDIAFTPSITPPASVSATPFTSYTELPTETYRYKITAVADGTMEESVASAEASVTNYSLGRYTHQPSDGPVEYRDNYNTVSWSVVPGAKRYHVYKMGNGLFGFVGTSEGTSFKDNNIEPDETDTPPEARNPFDGSGNYPSTATFYEQRRVFANSVANPQTIWMTASGSYRNMNVSTPTKDDDAVTVTIASRQVNAIRHLVPLTSLIALTAGGEFTIDSGSQADAIGPGAIRIKPQGYRGASIVPPLVIGNTCLFVQDKGAIVRDLGYTFESDSYTGNDLSILANHLFRGQQIAEWAYAQAPYSLVWAVRSDGALLCLTYEREQQVWAWTRHDTVGGVFESVAVVSEGAEDAVYFVVRRTINGVTKRYVERLHTRQFDDVKGCFFVDCGLSYAGAPTKTLSGLGHLEGQTVAILGDGNVFPRQVVAGGAVTLPHAVSVAHVGLPITAEMQTLDVEAQPTIQGKRKRVCAVTARVENSRGLWAGPAADQLVEVKPTGLTAYGGPIPLVTGDVRVIVPPRYDAQGSVFIRQTDPLPLTVLALIPELEVGS